MLFGGIFVERKIRYDYAFKFECAELVINVHYSCKSVSNKKDICESNTSKTTYICILKLFLYTIMNQNFDILVVGGGAAGFFTAINIVEKNPKIKVAILERGAEVLSKV